MSATNWGCPKFGRIFSSSMTRFEDRLIYRVRGSGFLKHMVRNIVGVLLEAGKGNLDARGSARQIAAGLRDSSGPHGSGAGIISD